MSDANKPIDYARVQELHRKAELALEAVSAENANKDATPESRAAVKAKATQAVKAYQVAYNLWRSPARVSNI